MSRFERTLMREERYSSWERKNPSFSSTLLEKIYRSIDEGDAKVEDLRFYREAMQRNQSKDRVKSNMGKSMKEEEEILGCRREYLVQKWSESRVLRKVSDERKDVFAEFQRKLCNDHEHDQDFLFFSSTSSSSDSSSGGFSSSDTESLHGTKSRAFCFVPPKPKPIKTEKKQGTLFEENLIKSKSRAMKIYGNLKKVGQPISPGGRLANFINSLFTAGNSSKKSSSKCFPSVASCDDERKIKSGQVSTCSSASSFSRSCLSKNSPSTRERLRNGVKRRVRFYPVSVIVDEDSRPCGHKHLYGEDEEKEEQRPMPDAGRLTGRKEEVKIQAVEKSRRVEEMAREFLKEYHKSRKKSMDEDEDDDDDALSYSSSDLFELDHLSVMRNDWYREELPVYETTRLDQNAAISSVISF